MPIGSIGSATASPYWPWSVGGDTLLMQYPVTVLPGAPSANALQGDFPVQTAATLLQQYPALPFNTPLVPSPLETVLAQYALFTNYVAQTLPAAFQSNPANPASGNGVAGLLNAPPAPAAGYPPLPQTFGNEAASNAFLGTLLNTYA